MVLTVFPFLVDLLVYIASAAELPLSEFVNGLSSYSRRTAPQWGEPWTGLLRGSGFPRA